MHDLIIKIKAAIKYLNSKQKKRIFIRRIVPGAVLVLILYIIYLLYLILWYFDLKNAEITSIVYTHASPEHLLFDAVVKNSKVIFTFEVENLKIGVKLFGKKVFDLRGYNFKLKHASEFRLHQCFKIDFDCGFEPENMIYLRQLRKVEGVVSMNVRFKLFKLIPVYFPIWRTQAVDLQSSEWPIAVIRHDLVESQNITTLSTELEFKNKSLSIIMSDFHFQVFLNGKQTADVYCRSGASGERLFVNTVFNGEGIENIANSLPSLFDLQKIDVEFRNLIFSKEIENVQMRNLFFYSLCSFEMHKNGEKMAPLVFSKKEPVLKMHFNGFKSNELAGFVSFHRSFLDNFIYTDLFIDTLYLPNLNAKVSISNTQNKESVIATGSLKHFMTPDYLSFEVRISVIDFNHFVYKVMNHTSDEYVKISSNGDNFIEKAASKVHFLWNFFNNFAITGRSYLSKWVDSCPEPPRSTVDYFYCNLQISDERKDQFRVKALVSCPAKEENVEYFYLSWDRLFIILNNSSIENEITVEEGNIYLVKNFYSYCNIFRSNSNIEINAVIKQLGDNLSEDIQMIENKDSRIISVKCNLIIPDNENRLIANLNHSFIRGSAGKRDVLTRILKKIKIKVSRFKAVDEISLKVKSIPISFLPSSYCVTLKMEAPEIKINLGSKNEHESKRRQFLEIVIKEFNASISQSKWKTGNLKLYGSNNSEHLELDLKINWEELKYANLLNTAPDESMKAVSRIINSIFNLISIERPKPKDFIIERREYEQIKKFTAEDLVIKILSNVHFVNKESEINFVMFLPATSLSMNKLPEGLSFGWEDVNVAVSNGDNKKASVLNIQKGQIMLKTEEENEVFQKDGQFSFTAIIQHGFLYGSYYEVKIRYLVENISYTLNKNDLEGFNGFFRTENYKESAFDFNFKFKEIERSIIDGNEYIEINQVIVATNYELCCKIAGIIGSLIKRINLVNYPISCSINVDLYNGQYVIPSEEFLVSINLHSKIDSRLGIIYPNTDINEGYSSIMLQNKLQLYIKNTYTVNTESSLPFIGLFLLQKYNSAEYLEAAVIKTLETMFNFADTGLNYSLDFVKNVSTTISIEIPFDIELFDYQTYITIDFEDQIALEINFNHMQTQGLKRRVTVIVYNTNMGKKDENRLNLNIYDKGNKIISKTILIRDNKWRSRGFQTLVTMSIKPLGEYIYHSKFFNYLRYGKNYLKTVYKKLVGT